MVFLIMKLTQTWNLQGVDRIGTKSPWTEYVQFLSPVPLPTCWSENKLLFLEGTSLTTATTAKLGSLEREFEHFRSVTLKIDWCRTIWWDDNNLTFQEWLLVDAWYRSRVLELPNLGPSMVPILDFCNHSMEANARYDVDVDGNVNLTLNENAKDSQEITIK